MFARSWLGVLLALAICSVGANAQGEEALVQDVSKRLLIVDIDDLGWEFLLENPFPFFQLLETEARTYDAFYASPLCTPTRSMMQLGAYGSHPAHLCTGLIDQKTTYSMPTDGPLEPLAQVISKAGLSTAKVGKWHLSPYLDSEHPNRAGWQHYSGVPGNPSGIKPYFRSRWVTDGVVHKGKLGYLTTLETDRAIEFLEKDTNLVSVSYHAVHDPYHEPPAELHSVESFETDTDRARAMLEALTNELDRLVRVARARDYTVLLFSDNGSLALLGGGKGSLTDEGTRVPLWALGAGITPGHDASLVGVVDLYATTLAYFEIEAGPTRGPDSISFLPTWSGADGQRKLVYLERFDDNGTDPRTQPERWSQAVRDRDYLYVRAVAGPRERLIDLSPDGPAGNLLLHTLEPKERSHYERLAAYLNQRSIATEAPVAGR